MLRMNKSTRYALYAAIELARASGARIVTAGEVARRYGVPATVVAKVFQQLAHAGIAVGIRGSGGGYRLARLPSNTTMLEVIDALEPLHARASAQPPAEDAERRLRELLDRVDEAWRSTFGSISLGALAGAAEPRPAP